MKTRIIVLLALLLLPGCGKWVSQSTTQNEVDAYMAALLEGNNSSQLEMRLFEPSAIPRLLSYADDGRILQAPPTNPLSSALPQCSVGIYALWTIEGIRIANGGVGRFDKPVFGYPSLAPALVDVGADPLPLPQVGQPGYAELQNEVAKAYRDWWNSGDFDTIINLNPLAGTDLHWY
ncbi:MAG: hypothetical protein IJP73_01525 [Bacteroidales bacterium]|nr:hypothetical protein [Bacteroidales bacterium]